LLFFCCKSDIPTISNEQNYNPDFKLNLTSEDSGLNKYSTTVNWNSDELVTFGKCSLFVEEPEWNTVLQQNSWTFAEMSPGEFIKVDCFIFDTDDLLVAKDSIQIFTRPLFSVTNFYYEKTPDTNFYYLSWTPSTEEETDYSHYLIDRFIDSEIDETYSISDLEISSFTDTTTLDGIQYDYTIETVDNEGFSRMGIPQLYNSHSNGFTFVTVSDNYSNHIELNWDCNEYLSDSVFYQIDIWRNYSPTVVEDDGESVLLATIINPEQTKFEDRYEIGTGKTWYYRLYGFSISGTKYKSDIKSGRTIP